MGEPWTGGWWSSPFMPHGHCYLWQSPLIWLHLGTDTLIALGYNVLPVLLVYVVRKRHDLPFNWMFLMFGAFIVACGTTHAVSVLTLWVPAYWLTGVVKAWTAGVLLATAALLAPLVPKALALPSPTQLATLNRELAAEIQERRHAEAALMQREAELEVALRHREVLLREVHHRVKNNLAMIAGLVRIAGRRAPADAQGVLRDISRRIVTVGQIYTQIHDADDLRRVDLAAYMRAICDNVASSLGRDNVSLETALAPCTVDIDTAVPLGLIVGELLTNAYKHAFPGERSGRIAVTLACEGTQCAIAVADDGIGLSEMRRTGASGLGLANALANQIGGHLESTGAAGAGAQLRLTFRLASRDGGRRPP
jgi:two-component sensor histidine kinase